MFIFFVAAKHISLNLIVAPVDSPGLGIEKSPTSVKTIRCNIEGKASSTSPEEMKSDISINDMIEYKFQELKESNARDHGEIIEHQKVTNSRVTHLEDCTDKIKVELKPLNWIVKNPKTLIALSVVAWFALSLLSTSSIKLIELLKIFKF